MKTYKLHFFLIIILSIPLFSKGEKIICGTFNSVEKIKIKIFEPIYGYFNMSFYSPFNVNSCVINNTNTFYYKTKSKEHSTFVVYITSANDVFIERSILTLFSNDSIHLVINLIGKGKPIITHSGNNAEGQRLFNIINSNPSLKYEGVMKSLDKFDINKVKFLRDIENDINFYTIQFQKLFQKHKISKEFYEYEVVNFRQLLYQDIIDKLLNNYKKRERFTKDERDEIVMYFFKILPVSNKYLKSSFISHLYITQYFNFLSYLKMNLSSLEPLFEDNQFLIDNKSYLVRNFCSQYLYIEDKGHKEDLWAIDLLSKIVIGSPDPIIETINQYKVMFPNSKWLQMLDKQYIDFKELKEFKYSLTTPINYFDVKKEYKTLAVLLNDMPKNNGVFIDIWASWCGPCILAFEYNKNLDSFLLANKIERLYISLDNEANINKWENAINKYSLGGYHFIANQSFIFDIKKIIGKSYNGNLEIPRYMLIDENRNIVVKQASSPIDYSSLTKEIKKFLIDNK